MKRYIANLRLDVDAESIGALNYLLETVARGIHKDKPRVWLLDVSTASIRAAQISRVRAAPKRKR